jgi:glutamate-1-semialdehyde 2,1-aminomutase
MTTLGKIMGGGFPMAAFCGKEEIMRMIAPSGKVYQAGTYNGNPVSVTASLRVLSFLLERRESFYSEMEEKCGQIVKSLRRILDELGLGLQINHIASMFQLFFTDQRVCDYASAMKADNSRYMEVHRRLLEQGIFLPPSQYETCFLSLAHTSDDIDKTVKGFETALRRLQH